MPKVKKTMSASLVLIACVDIALLAAVFSLMNYVQQLLYSDLRINLTEIVTQNKDVITSKLMLEVNNLNLVSKQLSERFEKYHDDGWETRNAVFAAFAEEKSNPALMWADASGRGVFCTGKEVDISGRKYFRLAIEGTQNISDRTVSRVDGEDIFIISVPLRIGDQIIGTVQQQYTPQQFYDLCSVSLFSEQGSMHIINSDGYILLTSQQNEYSRESDNYYRMIYQENPEVSNQLEQDVRAGRAGFAEAQYDGRKVFSAYTPVEELYDWYLICSVDTGAVSGNTTIVVRMFYGILISVVLIFGASMLYILRLQSKRKSGLERVAFVDPVTGGNTYTWFMVQLEQLAALDDRPLFIFTFDIDNFKYINSIYGFDYGDRILRSINDLYQGRLSEGELIARVYGDHFVAMLYDASEQRLERLYEPEVSIDGTVVYLSAGLYPVADRTESISLMVDKASMAAQKIKGRRYKRVEIYSAEFDRQMIYNEQLKRAVEQALDNDEMIPFFQPKADIDSRMLMGAEALARWRTPEGKLVPPCDFIPICEKTGMIIRVDMMIFEKTLRFLQRNLQNGLPCVPISVNFSRVHLLNPQFTEQVLAMLQAYGVPPELVELELTETVIFENHKTISDFIGRLHEAGFKISMDDFGSGYSSLHMLEELNIDVLKIDRGLISNTAESARQTAVFAAVAQMAHTLDIKVVVEGVETQQNVELMREFGCHVAQGYYFAKPMDEPQFQQIFEAGVL